MPTQSRVGGLTLGGAPVSTTPQELGPAVGGVVVLPMIRRFASGVAVATRQRNPFSRGFVYGQGYSKIGADANGISLSSPGGSFAPESATSEAVSVALNEASYLPSNAGSAPFFAGSAIVVLRKLQPVGAGQNNSESLGNTILEAAGRFLARGDTITTSLVAGAPAWTHESWVLFVPRGHIYDPDNLAAGATQDYPYTGAND